MRTFFILGALLLASGFSCAGEDARKAAEEARESLRKQGFKTDLSEFNFFTDADTAARSGVLTNILSIRPALLLQPVGRDAALIAWKEKTFEQDEGYQMLPRIEEVLTKNQTMLDEACAAALAGPIHFALNAQHGSYMLLPHLGSLQNLSQALAGRMVVELRDNHRREAWTNLMALTRLATAWEPESTEISHIVRFKLARTAWKCAWQALQAGQWTEEQLFALQHEWETPEFFKGLPDTLAFQRACLINACIQERQTPAPPSTPPGLKDTVKNALRSPSAAIADAKYRKEQAQYPTIGTYEDERDLLLFFRDREIEWRKAVGASTWLQMRAMPGVTNTAPFRSKHYSRMQSMLNTRQISMGFQLEGKGLLGLAAETEARRRLAIAAIALERYRLIHGSYPQDLASLAPEVLKGTPIDFMDGNPLRYRLVDPKAFVLHSVGLDCLDEGGNFAVTKARSAYPNPDPADGPDLIWPRGASQAEAQAFAIAQTKAREELIRRSEHEAEEAEKEQEQHRQKIIEELAAIYGKGQAPRVDDPQVKGGLASEVLRNKSIAGPRLRLFQMLTLQRITTKEDPDIATFELPISYDALTNIGTLRLLCDADPREKYGSDWGSLQEWVRGTNGNCLLVWNTMYDPPGKHFLQAELSIDRWHRGLPQSVDTGDLVLKGPLYEFVSTNVLQYFPMGDVFSEKGAFFHVKLARPVGSYTLKITSPSGELLHTITGSTTNGIVDVEWNLVDDSGKRYTNEMIESTWTVTFAPPDEKKPN